MKKSMQQLSLIYHVFIIMSGLLLGESNCAEIEFLAEETLVSIIPAFDHPVFRFISV